MYDALTTTYTFPCPTHGQTRVRLSRFRRLEELPGAQHPVVYRIEFACGCGTEHPGLVSHEDLDWAPLGLGEDATFVRRRQLRDRRVLFPRTGRDRNEFYAPIPAPARVPGASHFRTGSND